MTDKTFPWKLLLALDGSEHSQAAIEMLSALQFPAGSSITIITVISERQWKNDSGMYSKYLAEVKSALEKNGQAVDSQLAHGHPAKEIVKLADSLQPDLIIMGAKGLRATMGIFLGGTVQQVVEYASWPVWVVRAPFLGLSKAIFTTDGSAFSRDSEEYISRFPWPEKTDIVVLHVLPPFPRQDVIYPAWYGGGDILVPLSQKQLSEDEESDKQEQRLGEQLVKQVVDHLQLKGLSAQGRVLRGDAATEIINFTQREQVKLIIVGGRGVSQVESWFLGSVTRKLVHYAHCSVLIVKNLGSEPA